MINGYEVCKGDRVFVLNRGFATVISVGEDQSFTVSYGGGTQHFSTGGYIGNRRQVYWSDPIIIDPPKKAKWWRGFVSVVLQLYGVLFTKGEEDDKED